MKHFHIFRFALTLLLVAAPALAQDGVLKKPIRPIQVDETFLQQSGGKMEFEHSDRSSAPMLGAKRRGQITSVPTFTTSFNFQGQNYPVTMVGGAPEKGETTEIGTQMIAISLFFDGFVDENGNNVVLDATPLLPRVVNSPNFRIASYRTGVTQFADAVQRAQFYGTMKDEWHTLLRKPELLKPVQIEVPANTHIATVFQVREGGTRFAVVDTAFFISQLNTIIQLQKLDVQGLPIALTNNIFLSPGASVPQCCVVGFHTAFDAGIAGKTQPVQTFIWASYASPGIFGGTFEDVIAVSHEISEWINDPFIANAVPRWQYPGSTECQGSLETGDPLEAVPNAGFPVTIDGVTFHPQSEAMLQWFSRKSSSDAFDGAYSFPDTTLLRTHSQPCAGR
jgi:hypothetical protein